MKQINISEAFIFAFETLKKYPMLILGPAIFLSFLSNILILFINKFSPTGKDLNANSKLLDMLSNRIPPYAIVIIYVLVFIILAAAIIVGITLEIGRIRIAIHAYNNSEGNLSWSVYNNFGKGLIGRYFLAGLLIGLIVLVGLVLLVIPGIILAIMFEFALFVLVEKKAFIIDSLKISSNLTNGIKWQLFGFGLLVLFITIIIMIPINLLNVFKIDCLYLPLETIVTPIVGMYFSMAMLYIYKDIADQEENLDRLIAESSESKDIPGENQQTQNISQ